jgi:hypothetical protein
VLPGESHQLRIQLNVIVPPLDAHQANLSDRVQQKPLRKPLLMKNSFKKSVINA